MNFDFFAGCGSGYGGEGIGELIMIVLGIASVGGVVIGGLVLWGIIAGLVWLFSEKKNGAQPTLGHRIGKGLLIFVHIVAVIFVGYPTLAALFIWIPKFF